MCCTCLYLSSNAVFILNHSSAGIGRTGVLITMETGMSLLDRGKPVFPLEIVKTLRDQRAMMVQTTVQTNAMLTQFNTLGFFMQKKKGFVL